MDRGTLALISSRSDVVRIQTGAQGSPYDDATQSMMLANRDRIYADSSINPETRHEHDLLFNRWLSFYTNPIREPDTMTAPERAIWYRERAIEWTSWLDARNMSHSPGSPANWVPKAVGLGILVAFGIYVVSK